MQNIRCIGRYNDVWNILDEVNFEDNYEEHKRVIFPRKNEGEEPKGIYRPIDVDIDYIDDVWNITVIDFCERLVIALGLSRMGYKITDIYEQGFTVLLSLNVVEEQLKHDIFEIMDHLIHHDDAYLCQKLEGFSNKFGLNHKFCGISDSSRSSVGSYRIASERNIRHQDIRIPVCEES